jgi:hypothetical protein
VTKSDKPLTPTPLPRRGVYIFLAAPGATHEVSIAVEKGWQHPDVAGKKVNPSPWERGRGEGLFVAGHVGRQGWQHPDVAHTKK